MRSDVFFRFFILSDSSSLVASVNVIFNLAFDRRDLIVYTFGGDGEVGLCHGVLIRQVEQQFIFMDLADRGKMPAVVFIL